MQITLSPGKFGGAVGIMWCDLETTGDDPVLDDIIEFGGVCTDWDFNIIDQPFSCVIEPDDSALGRLMKNPVVRNMHEENGLLQDVLEGKGVSSITAESEILRWLGMVANKGRVRGDGAKVKWMLAGSGVEHFDRHFLREHMSGVANRLVFAPLDIGNVRRLLRLDGIDLSGAGSSDKKNHRALDDILLHLEEARCFRERFREAFHLKV